MGIRGLTTYISRNDKKYLKDFKLHSSYVIIDGNNLVCQTFVRSCNRGYCLFGGDYDKYAQVVREFFLLLAQCDIKAIVVFDGGYERRKLKTVISRLEERAAALKHVNPGSSASPLIFPLLLKAVFKQVLTELSVSFVQCDFEADPEIAALARKYDCPVISHDSDFFVYNVQYIPIPTLELQATPINFELKTSSAKFCLNCKIFRIEYFLDSFGGMDKSLMPLLSSLLGNDYVKISVFKKFHAQLKVSRGKGSPVQRRIARVIEWLRKEDTFDTAFQRLLEKMKKYDRPPVVRKIKDVLKTYTQDTVTVEPHLPQEFTKTVSSVPGFNLPDLDSDMLNVNDIASDGVDVEMDELGLEDGNVDSEYEDVEEEEEDEEEEEEEEDDELENELPDEEMDVESTEGSQSIEKIVKTKQKRASVIPEWLLSLARRGMIESCVVDVLTIKCYFAQIPIEDHFLTPAHTVSIPLLKAMFGILLGKNGRGVNYYAKNEHGNIQRYWMKPSEANVPNLQKMNEYPLDARKEVLLNLLNVPSESSLNAFSDEWKLYASSIIYWIKNTISPTLTKSHVISLCLCFISLSIIDGKLGFYRKRISFLKKYGKIHKRLVKIRGMSNEEGRIDSADDAPDDENVEDDVAEECNKNEILSSGQTSELEKLVADIDIDDCIVTFDLFTRYHQMNEELKTHKKSFSISDIHAFAQFQIVLQMSMTLNSLLLFPFKQCFIPRFYSGTFVYNMCVAINNCKNVDKFIQSLFMYSPKMLNLFNFLLSSILTLAPVEEVPEKKKRFKKAKRSKKRRKMNSQGDEKEEAETPAAEVKEEEHFYDENNIYSLLSTV